MHVITVTEDIEVFTCNAYLVLGEEPTLIDTGATPAVVDAIAEHTDELSKVVLTHQHGDHIGGLDAVCEAFEPNCYAYEENEHRTHALTDGETVQVGDEQFAAIYTPGHAEDHLALFSDAALFSGDVVVYNDGAFDDGSFGRTDYPGMSRERLIESIQELLTRLPETVEAMYAGHGDVYTGDVRAVIERALSRAERREPKYPDD